MDYIMNKYQEALDIIVEKTDMLNNTCLHLPKCMKNGICHYVSEGLCEDYERVKLLQELVDKEKPMKVKHVVENGWHKYVCGSCDGELELKHCYCPECGQELDWRD